MLASVVLGLGQAAIGWRGLVAPMQDVARYPDVLAGLVVALVSMLVMALTVLVSRRHNLAALVLLLLLFIAGLPDVIRTLSRPGPGPGPIPDVGLGGMLLSLNVAAQLLAFGLAGTPSAQRWLSGRGLGSMRSSEPEPHEPA